MKLIGTIHWDLQGYRRLTNLLHQLRPKVVTVEFPCSDALEDVVDFILRLRGEKWKQIEETDIVPCAKRLTYNFHFSGGYESIAAYHYALATGAAVFYVDHPDSHPVKALYLHDDWGASVEGLMFKDMERHGITDETLEKIPVEAPSQAFQKLVDAAYYDPEKMEEVEGASIILCGGILSLEEDYSAEQREAYMTEMVRAIMPDVHIGGLAHVARDMDCFLPVPPLSRRLERYVKERIRLCDVDR